MFKCKQVAEALAQSHYDDLPRWKRLGLKLHVAICFVCSRYHKQVMLMQDCSRGLAEHEKDGCCQLPDSLSDEAKARMRKKISDR
jgi:hypothetical protein